MSESIPTSGDAGGGNESPGCAVPQTARALAIALGVAAVLAAIGLIVALRCWLF